jgi:Xaa-Pro aminopeptidase
MLVSDGCLQLVLYMQTDSHVLMWAGKSFADKLKDLREQLEENKASAMVVSMLDEIAWLFNLRASDITYNPGRRKAL